MYSPSCPACVVFKPNYIEELTTNDTKKFPQIEFFAVSCDDHFDTCRDFGINNFLTLRSYKAGEDSGTKITDDEARWIYGGWIRLFEEGWREDPMNGGFFVGSGSFCAPL